MNTSFYFYSSTNRRMVLQTENNGKPAFTLSLVGTITPAHDLHSLITRNCDENKYFVTSVFGQNEDKEKVESRPLTSLFDAINWAEFTQDNNKRKNIKVWRLVSDNTKGIEG